MKHLVSLAVKYLRRQRMRTVLTFLCITLSVFIFNLLCNAAIVVRGMLIAEETRENGTWQVDVSSWLPYAGDSDAAMEAIKKHVVVDDYYLSKTESVQTYDNRDANGYLSHILCSVDGRTPEYYKLIIQMQPAGDSELQGNDYYNKNMRVQHGNEALVPNSLADQGYKIGDTVTLTFTPVRSRLTDDAPQLQEIIAEQIEEAQQYAAEQGNPFDPTLPVFRDSPSAQEQGSIVSKELMDVLQYTYYDRLDELLVYDDEITGTPLSVTVQIAGFYSVEESMRADAFYLVTSPDCGFSITDCLDESFAAEAEVYNEYEHPVFTKETGRTALLTIHNSIDFDDAVEKLYDDLGLPQEERQLLVHPSMDFIYMPSDFPYHMALLSLQFRGADAIASWLTNPERFVLVILFLVLAFITWALMRFVIDNTFEVSVQERSAQFATLRIMGASRRQISVLVGMEALFYSLFAIPLGCFLAYLCKCTAITKIEQLGLEITVTSMPAMTALGIVLALAAVFISSYTSSLWAARAYAPLEATKRSDLKGNRRETVWTKSLFARKNPDVQPKKQQRDPAAKGLKAPRKAKLNRSSRKFLLHYTTRNIRRSRSRFIISVITMTIGTALFCAGINIGIFASVWIKQQLDIYGAESDFRISVDQLNPDQLEKIYALAENYYQDNENYRNMQITAHILTAIPIQESDAVIGSYLPEAERSRIFANTESEIGRLISVYLVTRSEYDDTLAAWTGVSYDDFVESGAVIFQYNACEYKYNSVTDDPVRVRKYPDSYQSTAGADGSLPVIENYYGLQFPILGVACQEIKYEHQCMLLPAENAALAISPKGTTTFSGMEYAYMSIDLLLSDSSHYRSAESELEGFRSELVNSIRNSAGNNSANSVFYVNVWNDFFECTGLSTLLGAIGAICLIVLLSVWLVGIFTMVNTVNTGVLNRCDELMMLRTVGMTKKQLRKTVALESMIYCAVSTVIGCVLGIAGCLYLVAGLGISVSNPFYILLVMAASLLLTLGVNVLIARLAARPGLRVLHRRMEAGGMMQ